VVVPPETATNPSPGSSDATPDSGPNSIQGDLAGYTLNPGDQVDGVVNVTNITPTSTLSIPTNQLGTAGTTITVPINISNPNPSGSSGLTGADAAILFNKNLLSVAPTGAVLAGSDVPAGWTVFYGVDTLHTYLNDPTLGAIGLHLTNGANPPQTSTTPGSLWLVTFTITSGVSGSTTLNLVPSAQVGGSTTMTDVTGANGAYQLSPTPTTAATDTVDGSIAISSTATTHFMVSAASTTTAGAPLNFTVTALKADNSTDTNYTDTVHFTSSDGAAVLPGNMTLTNGVGTFSATLKTAGNQTITASDSHGLRLDGLEHHRDQQQHRGQRGGGDALRGQRPAQRDGGRPLQLHGHGLRPVQQYGDGLRRHGALHQQRRSGRAAGQQHAEQRDGHVQRHAGHRRQPDHHRHRHDDLVHHRDQQQHRRQRGGGDPHRGQRPPQRHGGRRHQLHGDG
jgi:hypothetical protein